MILAAASVLVIGAVAAAAVSIIKQLQAIHLLVNSAASDAAAKLIALEKTVAQLQEQRVMDAKVQTAQAQTLIPNKGA